MNSDKHLSKRGCRTPCAGEVTRTSFSCEVPPHQRKGKRESEAKPPRFEKRDVWPMGGRRAGPGAALCGSGHAADRAQDHGPRRLPGRGSFQKRRQRQAAGFGGKPIPRRPLSRNRNWLPKKGLGSRLPLGLEGTPGSPPSSTRTCSGQWEHRTRRRRAQSKAPGEAGSWRRSPDGAERAGRGGAGEVLGAATSFWRTGSAPQGRGADEDPELRAPSLRGASAGPLHVRRPALRRGAPASAWQ